MTDDLPKIGSGWGRLFDDVRAHVDGVELYRYLGGATNVPKGKAQATVRCIAPDHPDNDPSMTVFADGFKCHACGVGGDVVAMWSLVHGRRPDDKEGRKRSAVEMADYAHLSLSDYGADDDYTLHHSTPSRAQGRRDETPATSTRDAYDVHPARREIFGRIWELVEPVGLSEQAKAWFESRALNPAVAHLYGVRDWAPVVDQIADLLKGYAPDAKRAAGLYKADGTPWGVLAGTIRGDSWARGVYFPVWHPDHPDAPVAVRHRRFDGAKRGAQPTSDPKLAHVPLGLVEPPTELQRMVYYWPHLHGDEHGRRWAKGRGWKRIDDDSKAPAPYSVVVCEGETDWLSVASAAADLQTSERIIPVAWCEMAKAWPDRFTEILEGARRVVVAFDVGSEPTNDDKPPNGEARNREILRSMIARLGREHTNRAYRCELQPDDCDLNDLREDKKLAPKLRDWLGDHRSNGANTTGV